LGSNDHLHRARRHNLAYRLALPALGCLCNMERDGSRRLNLAMAIKNDIAGWTPQLRDRKIEQLTSVIATMNTGLRSRSARRVRGRNRFVVDRLVDKVNAALPAPSDLFGCSRRYRRGPRNRCCVHLRQHLVPGSGTARRVGVLPGGDAPPRHPWDRAKPQWGPPGAGPSLVPDAAVYQAAAHHRDMDVSSSAAESGMLNECRGWTRSRR
jgi:hypothetical protein